MNLLLTVSYNHFAVVFYFAFCCIFLLLLIRSQSQYATIRRSDPGTSRPAVVNVSCPWGSQGGGKNCLLDVYFPPSPFHPPSLVLRHSSSLFSLLSSISPSLLFSSLSLSSPYFLTDKLHHFHDFSRVYSVHFFFFFLLMSRPHFFFHLSFFLFFWLWVFMQWSSFCEVCHECVLSRSKMLSI